MMDFSRKDIHVTESVQKNLASLKEGRLRIGLTQRKLAELAGVKLKAIQNYEYRVCYPMLSTYLKLAEILGWDMSEDPNYEYYRAYQNSHNPMYCRKRRYGYTNVELSRALHISEESVRHVVKKMGAASVANYARVKQLFMEEAQRVHR